MVQNFSHSAHLPILAKSQKQHKTLPTLHITMYTTDADPNEKTFSWDTDGTPFIIDNSVMAIISKERRIFSEKLTPTNVTLETANGVSTKTQLVGTLQLVITDGSNIHHSHDVLGCMFDLHTLLNILGVPALGTFFNDHANASSHYKEDGTTIKSGATKPYFFRRVTSREMTISTSGTAPQPLIQQSPVRR